MGIALSASGDFTRITPFFFRLMLKTKNGGLEIIDQKVINCPHCGKIISMDAFAVKKTLTPKCPQCSSNKSFKNGFRHTYRGKVQTFLCRDCGYRFS
jgi:ssDNA-binding Zn-finger/Zn-ribbon topoisomerase 1